MAGGVGYLFQLRHSLASRRLLWRKRAQDATQRNNQRIITTAAAAQVLPGTVLYNVQRRVPVVLYNIQYFNPQQHTTIGFYITV